MLMLMKYDKENGEVGFIEETHSYFTKEKKQKCISVTTLIEEYCQPFDSEFWSMAKALENILGDDFANVKTILYRTKSIDSIPLEQYGISGDLLKEEQEKILQAWKQKNIDACERGNKVHKMQEESVLGGSSTYVNRYNNGGQINSVVSNNIKEDVDAAYPEVLISYISEDGELRLAGQSDLVVVVDNKVKLYDYKTSTKIVKRGHFNVSIKKEQKMKYPLGNISDSNYWHYALQLSTYAWMIEKQNPNLSIDFLNIVHFEHGGNVKEYEVPYLKDEVERMIKHYKNKLQLQELYEFNKEFEY